MTSSYTTNIALQEPATGDQVNTWGGTVNGNSQIIDQVFGGTVTYNFTTTDITLTVAEAAYSRIILTGSPSTDLNLILPTGIGGSRLIQNNTGGSGNITVLNGVADSGGGVLVSKGIITPIVMTGYRALYDNYQAVPPGTILTYAGGALPAGFLFTIGQTLNTADYPGLFGAISYTYGGSGSTFVLPDTRGRTLVAADNMGGSAANRLTGYSISTAGGSQNTTISTSQLPAHNHDITDPGHNHTLTDPGHTHPLVDGQNVLSNAGSYNVSGSGALYIAQTSIAVNTTGITISPASTGISTQNTGSGSSLPLVQPTIAVNHIIRF